MATGFSETEERLGRLVGKAIAAGVPESAYGLGGTRTVGPAVTYQSGAEGFGLYTNGTPGMFLGRGEIAAAETIRTVWRTFNATR